MQWREMYILLFLDGMLLCVCVHIYTYVYVYTYIHTCMYVCMYVSSIWLNVPFIIDFCLGDVPIHESRVFTQILSYYCIAVLCLSLGLLIFALHIGKLQGGCINIYKCYLLLLNWPLYHYVVSLFVFCNSLCFVFTEYMWLTTLCKFKVYMLIWYII